MPSCRRGPRDGPWWRPAGPVVLEPGALTQEVKISEERNKGRLPLIWSPLYEVDIGPHVFPTAKYRLVREELIRRGTITDGDGRNPGPVSWEDLAGVHSPDYLIKIRDGLLSTSEEMTLEVPFSPQLLEASLICCEGTLQTSREALAHGIAVHLGGGFHHAFRAHGEGFCLLNDTAVALGTLLIEGRISRGAVVDLDVHQGNGTASIFASDPRIFTFSMHQERNYPHPKPPSDLDVGLPDHTRDEAYLAALDRGLTKVMETHDPEIVIYLAGADPFQEDQLGGLSLTKDGLEARDRMVMDRCARAGVAVAVVLAGGYARREKDTVEIHRRTVEAARGVWGRIEG